MRQRCVCMKYYQISIHNVQVCTGVLLFANSGHLPHNGQSDDEYDNSDRMSIEHVVNGFRANDELISTIFPTNQIGRL